MGKQYVNTLDEMVENWVYVSDLTGFGEWEYRRVGDNVQLKSVYDNKFCKWSGFKGCKTREDVDREVAKRKFYLPKVYADNKAELIAGVLYYSDRYDGLEYLWDGKDLFNRHKGRGWQEFTTSPDPKDDKSIANRKLYKVKQLYKPEIKPMDSTPSNLTTYDNMVNDVEHYMISKKTGEPTKTIYRRHKNTLESKREDGTWSTTRKLKDAYYTPVKEYQNHIKPTEFQTNIVYVLADNSSERLYWVDSWGDFRTADSFIGSAKQGIREWKPTIKDLNKHYKPYKRKVKKYRVLWYGEKLELTISKRYYADKEEFKAAPYNAAKPRVFVQLIEDDYKMVEVD